MGLSTRVSVYGPCLSRHSDQSSQSTKCQQMETEQTTTCFLILQLRQYLRLIQDWSFFSVRRQLSSYVVRSSRSTTTSRCLEESRGRGAAYDTTESVFQRRVFTASLGYVDATDVQVFSNGPLWGPT